MDVQTGRSLRTITRKNYEDNLDDEIEGKRTFSVLEKLEDAKFRQGTFGVLLENGHGINLKYIQENGFEQPFLIARPEGLDIKLPKADFSVEDVKHLVGSRRLVDVIDVNTQQQIEMTMQQFAKYYSNSERSKIYNVISLEFSHTKLENYVEPPLLVRQLDWVVNVWPTELIRQQTDATNNMDDMKYPKVRKYVLMSVKNSYTDFHIDFCGTSVWYHVIKGRKIFWLIPPTSENLCLYENWVLSGKQQDVFLGDKVEKCSIIELLPGNTFLMPSGWIHAVFTAEDSLVFGGNFIHSFNIEKQFMICDIEERTRVPKKFRYPLYNQIMWYLVERYTELLEWDEKERVVAKTWFSNGEEGKRGVKRARNHEENKENVEKSGEKRRRSKSQVSFKEESEDECENDEIKNEDDEKKDVEETKWRPVYLTSREVNGLLLVIERMRTWSHNNLPESITDPDYLLDRLKDLLELQRNNDTLLCTTGEHFMKQIMKDTSNLCVSSKAKSIRSKPKRLSSGLRRRRTRCRACESCLRGDCGECKFCKDMRKFGGPGKMKQTCLMRQCENPTLPTCVMCHVCETRLDDDEDTLMECVSCATIAHPLCLDEGGFFTVIPDVNNCWKCPKCCDEKTGEPFDPQKFSDKTKKHRVIPASKKPSVTANSKPVKRKRELAELTSSISDSSQEESVTDEEDEDDEDDEEDDDVTPLSAIAKKKKKEPTPPIVIQEVVPTHVVRPRPITPPPDTLLQDNDSEHVIKRLLWLRIFSYLSQHELCTCMRVSRTWNRWCMERQFWSKITLPVGCPITASALSGIVRRQPLELHVSNTNITQPQLSWFLSRLPRLRELHLRMSTFATIGAFSRVRCPPIKVLDLSWSEKITDHVIENLLKPSNTGRRERPAAPGENSGRFRFLADLRISGCEISDASLRCIKRYLYNLSRLDISYCMQVTDDGVANLMDADSAFHKNIQELNLTGCEHVTDTCLEALKRGRNLNRIEMKKCENIHKEAFSEFSKCEEMKSVVLVT